MDYSLASIILRGTAFDWFFNLILLVAVCISGVAYRWRFFVQWVQGIRGREWATVSAVIDLISVVAQTEQTKGGEVIVGYIATLTYFYRNPELQTGDYSRLFRDETEAQAWAKSYKGKTVIVHVDPRDGSRSVLRKEDL